MPATDPRIDDYIERSAEFAQPILSRLRSLVHKAVPDAAETIKWGMPAFEYKGPLCNFAAFKQHCTFGLWKQALLEQDAFPATRNAMGSFGRITSADDLPPDDVIVSLIRQAAELNEKGIKVPKGPAAGKKEIAVPDYLTEALSKNAAARETFEKFSYSCRKEYVEWLTDAKTDATREKRLATAVEWMAEGKRRHWKYEKR